MTVQEMHYDFVQKLNKADSQQYRNFRIPEIDWYLNEAQLSYIKTIANPKSRFVLELTQRNIDDLNSIIVHNDVTPVYVSANRYQYNLNNIVPKFLYYVSAEAIIKSESCDTERVAKVFIMKHSDLFQKNDFYKSSFEWNEVAAVFEDNKNIILFDDGDSLKKGTFTIERLLIDYIKYPRQIFYGGYNTLDGELTQTDNPQECELPEHIHRDIVDIAVLIATGNLQMPDYQIKMNKIQLNNQ